MSWSLFKKKTPVEKKVKVSYKATEVVEEIDVKKGVVEVCLTSGLKLHVEVEGFAEPARLDRSYMGRSDTDGEFREPRVIRAWINILGEYDFRYLVDKSLSKRSVREHINRDHVVRMVLLQASVQENKIKVVTGFTFEKIEEEYVP